MNVRRPSEHALERKVNAVTRRLAATERAERMLGFTAKVSSRKVWPPWSNGGARSECACDGGPHADSRCEAGARRARGRRGAARDSVRLGNAGAGGCRVRTGSSPRRWRRSHACAVSSCTTALHLALVACGVGPGDEVVTVSHSFIATANAIRYCGATPVFVDVELDTFNMDVSQLEAAIGPRTRAILAVHQLGMPCDLRAITSIARRHKLPVIEDAACAIGSEVRWDGAWQPIGRPHGDVACFPSIRASCCPRAMAAC